MSTLGDRIRDARESKNLYQGQLAELIGRCQVVVEFLVDRSKMIII